jgi:glycosyltransferase involved in cell wall biosynthesis
MNASERQTNKPLISVIVPAYNVQSYLETCIESIVAQTYTNLQIIIIDDGSTDNTAILCDQLARTDSRITVFHTGNKGVSHARNIGLEYARGDYIYFIDADDWLDQETYSVSIDVLKESSIQMLQFPHCKNEGDKPTTNLKEPKIICNKVDMFNLWIKQNKVLTNYVCDKIFHKDIFSSLRFTENIRFEDRYIFSDILLSASKIVLSPWGLYHYRQHGTQYTNNQTQDQDFIRFQFEADIHTLQNIPPHATSCYVALLLNMFARYKSIILESPSDVINFLKSKIPNIPQLYKSNILFTHGGGVYLLAFKYIEIRIAYKILK